MLDESKCSSLGMCESVAPDDATFTIEEHVSALEDTLDALRLRDPFVLVGHSMGSLIASRYAATNRKRVSKLVLVSPPIYVSPTAIGDPLERAAMGLYLRAYEYLRLNKTFTMRNAAFLARMSPINCTGMRVFFSKMRSSISFGTPASCSFTTGRQMPSWKISVAWIAVEPAAIPPTSH